MTRGIKKFIYCCFLALGLCSINVCAEGIKLKAAELERAGNDWLVNASFQIQLTPGLEDAIQKGVVLHFLTEFDLTRARWYWFDERPATVKRQIRLSYQPLTQQYRIASEGFSFTAKSILEALQIVGTIGGWRVFDSGQIDLGKSYIAALKMTLDLSRLPKPFQVNALNNRDWNISSDWAQFPFSPDGKN